MSDNLVQCVECKEWTHPREDGSPRCPKHLATTEPFSTVTISQAGQSVSTIPVQETSPED